MGFHEVRLDPTISYGSQSGPMANTNIIETDGGSEERVARWSRVRHKYNLSKGVQSWSQLSAVKAFYLARNGAANGFRLKDWTDYTSYTDGSFGASAGTQDQLIAVGDGSTLTFQLVKKYTSGLITYTRNILKPVEGTVRIWVNSVEKTAGVDFTVDTTTGIVTFVVAPSNGHNIHASFEFDVPVRFEKETDAWLSISADDFGHGSVQINVIELFDGDPGYIHDRFMGGAVDVEISANTTLSTGLGALWVVSAASTGLWLSLPNPASYSPGINLFVIRNEGSNSFDIKDHSGSTLATLAAGEIASIDLSVQASGTKVWYCS